DGAVVLVLLDDGAVRPREARILERLAAEGVGDLVVAVAELDEVPLLVGAAGGLVLLEGRTVGGREAGVVEHLAARDVEEVVRRQHLSGLQALTGRLELASVHTGHRIPPWAKAARRFPGATPNAGAAQRDHPRTYSPRCPAGLLRPTET